jgi:carbamoyltransferase
MGLAAYGESRKSGNPWLELFDKIITISEGGFDLNPYYFRIGSHGHHPAFCDALADFVTSVDSDLTPVGVDEYDTVNGKTVRRYLRPGYIDLAYAAQTKLEEALISLVRGMKAGTGMRKLCLAGGVAMNCKANRAVLDACDLDGVFIHPASSDDGSAIGAAFFVARELDTLQWQPLTHACHGEAFGNDSISSLLENCGITYTAPDDICSSAARLLNDGKCIGWFDDGSEMGARALGARSIVANPLLPGVKDRLNTSVKYREQWRPYCPSLLTGHSREYLADPRDYPFMIMADNATQRCRDVCPDVVHVDGTVRPQTVDAAVLPKWAHLIEEFGSMSGHPVVLNTSFNVRGEPIVNNPYDALRTFFSTGLDALVLGDYLIEKRP